MGQLPVTDSAATADCDRAEAARYALLRRLAPSIRHNLVINLQPIGMIYEVLDRRLRGPQPDLAHVQASAAVSTLRTADSRTSPGTGCAWLRSV